MFSQNGIMPPQAQDIEKATLGSMMLDEVFYEQARNSLQVHHFYYESNRVVFEAFTQMPEFDISILIQRLKDNKTLESAGGDIAVMDLQSYAGGSTANYIPILIDKHTRRSMIQSLTRTIQKAYDNSTDIESILDELHSVSVGQDMSEKRLLSVPEIIERDKHTPKAEKLFTGISKLDTGMYEHSMRRGQLMVTMADSGHGKTQFALYNADKLLKQGYKVAWFQLEGYDSETANQIYKTAGDYAANMFVADAVYDLDAIKRHSRMLKKRHNIDYIVIDYMQNIEYAKKGMSKVEQTEHVSKQVTRMAIELNVVVNLLSQVTIDYNQRTGWKSEPRYDDVRWSQQIKQDASSMISVFRPSRIKQLVDTNSYGEIHAKDWEGNEIPYNSVFVREAKSRHGQEKWQRLHMIHTDDGLQLYSNRDDTQEFLDDFEDAF